MNYEELKNELTSISRILRDFPESLQETVYNTLISKLDQNLLKAKVTKSSTDQTPQLATPIKNNPVPIKNLATQTSANKKSSAKQRKSKNLKTYNYLPDLDLYSTNPKFADFFSNKSIKSNIIFNVICVYYLQDILRIDEITIDHIYTCYRAVKRTVGSLNQSLTDTCSSRFGYILRNNGNFRMTVGGYNLIQKLEAE